MAKVIAQANAPERDPAIGTRNDERTLEPRNILADVDCLMMEPERRHNVERSKPENILCEKCLVIRAPILVEAGGSASIVAIGEQIGTNKLLERCFTMIDNAAKGERAPAE